MLNLILIRHAHRDTFDRSQDNGLSIKGKAQAESLARFFEKKFGLKKADLSVDFVLYSSPKIRCIETIMPLSRLSGIKVQVHDDLDEHQTGESGEQFRKRIQKFLKACEKADQIVVACSHGDWLPEALKMITGEPLDMKKGSWAEISDGSLLSLLQSDDLA